MAKPQKRIKRYDAKIMIPQDKEIETEEKYLDLKCINER